MIFLSLPLTVCSLAADEQNSNATRPVQKVYVSLFGRGPSADYLRGKLISKLSRIKTIIVVDNPGAADLIVRGTAAMWLTGYCNPNPRVRYRNSSSVPVYDAKMTLEVENKQDNCVCSDEVKPRFWGSQYVSDNVVNQAAERISRLLRLKKNERQDPSTCDRRPQLVPRGADSFADSGE